MIYKRGLEQVIIFLELKVGAFILAVLLSRLNPPGEASHYPDQNLRLGIPSHSSMYPPDSAFASFLALCLPS